MTANNQWAFALAAWWMLLPTLPQPCLLTDVPDGPFSSPDFKASKTFDTDVTTLSGQIDDKEEIWTDNSSPLTYSPVATIESTSATPLMLEDETDELELQELHGAPGGPSRGPSRPTSPSLVCFSVALMMCLGLLAFRAQRRFAAKTPAPSVLQVEAKLTEIIQEEEHREQLIREKVAGLKAALPAAERLAALVDTEEAGRLLQAIRNGLSSVGEAEGDELLPFEAQLQTSLGAVNMLHSAARRRGSAMVVEAGDNVDDAVAILQMWDYKVRPMLDEKQTAALSPFVSALATTKDHYDRVSQHAYDVLRQLQRVSHPEDELEKAALLSAADELEALRQALSERREAASTIDKMRVLAEDAYRNLAVGQREKMSRWFHQDLEIVRELAQLEASQRATPEGVESGSVEGMASILQRAEQLIAEHKKLISAVVAAETFEEVFEAQEDAASHETSVQSFFADVWLDAAEVGGMKLQRMKPFIEVVDKAATSIWEDRQTTQEIDIKCRQLCAKLFPSVLNPQAPSNEHLNDGLAGQMMRDLQEAMLLAKDLSAEFEKVEHRVLEEELSEEQAKELADRAIAIAIASSSLKEKASAIRLQLHLLGLVEAEAASSADAGAKAAAHEFSAAQMESMIAHWLLDEFSMIKQSLKRASDLGDAIRIAGNLRQRADKLNSFVYADATSRRDNP